MTLATFLTTKRTEAGLTIADVHRSVVASGVAVVHSTVFRWFTGASMPDLPDLHALTVALSLQPADLAEAVSLAHRRTTTAATEGTDSRNGPTVLEGLASTSIGVSGAAQDVSGRAEERVSNMVTSGDTSNVAPLHRHTQPSERDE